ncbi:hypothetical protein P170DRAFT_430324 [Aspergillus steynii IBT 23096]|uniref:Peptidase C45 hydrolase domain-containing protein n=1 Tax=Aspergillus steynii IBT 23096 TaxID=1392250 RepID=A0A2I2FV29_9EURO|nr:uncharacterized protein P170DRAFT_430324 [Aspergillus steynii IBT 23096]PLB44426.1 hypothetical protein P170DRAFT_430324 [Aspergillus steynii IBT 23096]
MLRRMVLECSRLSEALTSIYQFPRHASNNLTLATAEGYGLCLEITPSRVYKVYGNLDDGYLIHTNHFMDNAFLSRDDVADRYPGGAHQGVFGPLELPGGFVLPERFTFYAVTAPWLDQYTNVKPRLLRTRNGSYSIGQRTVTIQYTCNVFYWYDIPLFSRSQLVHMIDKPYYKPRATNIAGLSIFASTFLERKVSFWAAYLLSLCALLLALVILVLWGKELVKVPPQGNILPQVGKCLAHGAHNGCHLDSVRPAYQLEYFNRQVS